MNAVINRVGLTFDLRDTYLEAGYSEVETAEFDQRPSTALKMLCSNWATG
jgi:hypothetical protein